MSHVPPFEKSVFLNCPFDDQYSPLLQAAAFCITDLGFTPRLAPENPDNSAGRLERIIELVTSSKYGIHDLSRCKVELPGEFARMNMPFELGIDFASSRFGVDELSRKSILVLEETRYDYQKALSDISGWDIATHGGDHTTIVRIVRRWLVQQAGAEPIGAAKILSNYADFQEWYWEREISLGASEEDIQEYPTIDFVRAMQEWVALGRPL